MAACRWQSRILRAFSALAATLRHPHYPAVMIDPFGRHISYLRVSVTDRCDFRCVYCMAEAMTFLPKAEVLARAAGEPLLRKNVMSRSRGLGSHLETGVLEELTLTTNGSQLAKYAKELA